MEAEYDERGQKLIFRSETGTVGTMPIGPAGSVATLLHVAKAVNNHDRLVEQLRALEWCDGANVTDGKGSTCYVAACPSCSGVKDHDNFGHGLKADEVGHKEGCKLAALLKELED